MTPAEQERAAVGRQDDVCECGDWRKHHPNDGPCIMNGYGDLCHGFVDCMKFRLAGDTDEMEKKP